MKKIITILGLALATLQVSAQGFDPAFDGSGWREDVLSTGSQMGQAYNDILVQSNQKAGKRTL